MDIIFALLLIFVPKMLGALWIWFGLRYLEGETDAENATNELRTDPEISLEERRNRLKAWLAEHKS